MIRDLKGFSGANEAQGNEGVCTEDRIEGEEGSDWATSPFVDVKVSSIWNGACYAWIGGISYEAALVDPETIRSCIYGHIMRALCSLCLCL